MPDEGEETAKKASLTASKAFVDKVAQNWLFDTNRVNEAVN